MLLYIYVLVLTVLWYFYVYLEFNNLSSLKEKKYLNRESCLVILFMWKSSCEVFQNKEIFELLLFHFLQIKNSLAFWESILYKL